jgi:hypothetical protein
MGYDTSDEVCEETVDGDLACFINAVQLLQPQTASFTFIANTKDTGRCTYLNFESEMDMQVLKDAVHELLGTHFQARICPFQSELYGAPQKSKRYVVYAASVSHLLPGQKCEKCSGPKIMPASKAIDDLQSVKPSSPEAPLDHQVHPTMVSLSARPRLVANKPWFLKAEDWPLRHHSQERLLTIREFARLCGIASDDEVIIGDTPFEQFKNLVLALPPCVADVMVQAIHETYTRANTYAKMGNVFTYEPQH